MTEEEAIRLLLPWDKVADLKFENGMTFTEYHIDRIKRENNNSWNESSAKDYVTSLTANMREKYGE